MSAGAAAAERQGLPFMLERAGKRPLAVPQEKSMSHIEARDITLPYDTPGGSVPGVRGVSFAMEASEFVCIFGRSGCGKSTQLNIIAGFITPNSGHIRIAGHLVKGYGLH